MTTQALKNALEEIVDPIKFMQDRAKAEGMQLDGRVAVSLAENANYLQGIARKALAALATVDASPSPVSVQPISEQGLDAAIAKIIQMSASLRLETLLPKAREIIRAACGQPAQPISSEAQPVTLTDDEIVAMSSRAGLPCFNDEHRKRSIRLVRDALAASPAPDVRPSAWGPILDALDQVPNDIKPEIGHLASLIRRTAPWQITAPDHVTQATDVRSK
jgi:hypothetical protein